jgi:hypothetical protein
MDMGSTDLLSLIIATLAVVLSLITVVLQRWQQQREAYRGIYEVLMSEQLQRGRWLISEISQPGDLPKDRSADFYLIHRTLGWFDTLAMYHQRRVVPRRWVIECGITRLTLSALGPKSCSMIVWKGVQTMRPGSASGRFCIKRPIIKAVDCVAARKTWQQLAANRPGSREGFTTSSAAN